MDIEAEKKNDTLTQWDVNGIKIAVGWLIDEMFIELRELWMNSHETYDQVREMYEDETLEHGHRNKQNISECNDGRDEYQTTAFCEQFWYNPFDNYRKQLETFENIIVELFIKYSLALE